MKVYELSQSFLEAAHYQNKYIVTCSKVFEPRYSAAQRRWYLMEYPEAAHDGWVKRGSVKLMTADEINTLLRFELLLPILDEDNDYCDEYSGYELYSMMC